MKNINPKTLKGNDKMNRIHELMNKVSPIIQENKERSVLEIYIKGPDNKSYGIVRENHDYYIKSSNKTNKPTVNDFKYIGGLENKKDYCFESYSKATKQLKLKLISLQEAYNVKHDNDTNVLLHENATNTGSMGFDDEFSDNEYEEEDVTPISQNVWKTVNWMDREEIKQYLENAGFAVYDTESDAELRATLVQAIENGDVILNERKDYDKEQGEVPGEQDTGPDEYRTESLDNDPELDPVGDEDADIDNDGDTDQADAYLRQRRHVITNKIQEKFGLNEDEVNYLMDEMINAAKNSKNVSEKCDDTLKKKVNEKYNIYSICTDSIAKTAGTTERSEWSDEEKERYERCIKDLKGKEGYTLGETKKKK